MEQAYSTTMKLTVKDKPITVTVTAESMEDLRALMDNHRVIASTIAEILENPKKKRRRTKKLAGGKSLIEEIEEVFEETGKKRMKVTEIRDILLKKGTYFGVATPYSAVYIALTQSPKFKKVGRGTFEKVK